MTTARIFIACAAFVSSACATNCYVPYGIRPAQARVAVGEALALQFSVEDLDELGEWCPVTWSLAEGPPGSSLVTGTPGAQTATLVPAAPGVHLVNAEYDGRTFTAVVDAF